MSVVSEADGYPITPKEHGTDFLMDHRHLWLRSPRQQAILRIRAEVIAAFRDFMDGEGFLLVDAPIFTPNACEGTTTLFETAYFDEKAYLTQSGQLYMEAAAMAFGRVYCFGPAFRAEKSKTRRHLIEFWMMEPEWAFATLDDVHRARGAAAGLHRGPRARAPRRGSEGRRARRHEARDGARRRSRASTTTTRSSACTRPGSRSSGAATSAAPTRPCSRSSSRRPMFVTNYPAAVKAFYMEPDPADPRLSLSCDCLAPEGYGEIIGGGQRMASLELLTRRIDEHGLPQEAFEWYKDLRRYGIGAALRLRHRRRAHAGVDRGARPRARDDSVPAHALPPEALTRACRRAAVRGACDEPSPRNDARVGSAARGAAPGSVSPGAGRPPAGRRRRDRSSARAGSATLSVATADSTLYGRLGGEPGMQAITAGLGARVASDGRINRLFADTDLEAFKAT